MNKITKNKKSRNLLSVICYLLSDCVGQTIIEIIVALSIIMLFLSGIAVVELHAIRNVEYGRNKNQATKLARQQLERARVVRDTAGIGGLSGCLSPCFIDSNLTPVQVTPTGTFGQSLTVVQVTEGLTECPFPTATVWQTVPVVYKATSVAEWSHRADVTPAAQVSLSTCISNWR